MAKKDGDKKEADKKQADKKDGDKKVEKLIEQLEGLSVLQLNQLLEVLQERWGISAAAPVAVAAGPAAPGAPPAAAEAAEEQTEFDLVLKDVGEQKIQVIKVVRELTGLGLRESKELVDSVPSEVRKGISKEEAEQARAKLEEVGATVEVR